jgi:hypothetical protein
MSPFALQLAAAVKASPRAQSALLAARQPDQAPHQEAVAGAPLLRLPNAAREAQRKRLAAFLGDYRDLIPDWTALASLAQERGLWPATTRPRDIIPILRAIAHERGLWEAPRAYAQHLTGALS